MEKEMTETKQHTGRLKPVKRWLDAVTEKNILKGTVIVVITGVLAAATAYTNATKTTVPIVGASDMIQTIAAVTVLIMTLLGWLLSALIYHVGANVLGGKGNLNRMFALAGYASLPALAQQLLRFINYSLLNQTTTASIGSLADAVFSYFNFFSVIGLILVGVAVMTNYGLSWRKAVLVALLPTLISIAFALVVRQFFGGAALTSGTQGSGLFGSLRRIG